MEKEILSRELCKAFSDYLKEKEGRFTQERAAIINGIASCEIHFTLEDVKQALVEQHFRVSQATLYNTLNELVSAGFVTRFLVKERAFYEVSFQKAYHCHQVCTNCGKITEFKNAELDVMIKDQKYKRFTYSDYTLMVYGICSVCKAQFKRASRMKNTKK